MLITEDDVGKLERLLRRTAAAEYGEATYGIASGFRDGKRLHDRFDAHLRDTGELICCAKRQPLLDGSRELLKVGYEPTDVICMVWSHSPEIVAMKGPIGVVAQFDVMGSKFVRRKLPQAPGALSKCGRARIKIIEWRQVTSLLAQLRNGWRWKMILVERHGN
jgi:hypothetical protein